jgi:hypothetical protein
VTTRLAVRAPAALSEAAAVRLLDLGQSCAEALKHVWQECTPSNAAAYRHALVRVVRAHRDSRSRAAVANVATQVPFPRVGPYRLERLLGIGGSGPACLAEHETTGQRVTLKLNSGAEGMVFDWFDRQLPPQFVQVYDRGCFDDPLSGTPWLWVAREYAPGGTWAACTAREPRQVHEVFTLACEGTAALHDNDVFQWSAHERNLLRTADGWKLADLGRCVMAATADDERSSRVYGQTTALGRVELLDLLDAGPWHGLIPAGVFQRDAGRMRRLRLDDCAGLAGLLCDLLGLDRWAVFLQGLSTRPVCSRRYVLTGHHRRDRQLSRVINRAWLGDAGGALATDAGRDWTSGYDDARELLADVQAAGVGQAPTGNDRLA